MDKQALYQRAVAIEAWMESRFVDANGVVYTFLDKETARPPAENLFHDAGPEQSIEDFHVAGFSRSELAAYENCGMCTGAYMQSLLYRYRAENMPGTLHRIRRCFRALRYIYEIGRQLEEGYFPKIYGNRFSLQTSTDQVLYAVMAMDHYYAFASDEEKIDIDRMIPRMIRFWVERGYKYTYFHLQDMQWPLLRFPPLLLLAYKHSGDNMFKREYDRLLAAGFTKEPGYAKLKMQRERMNREGKAAFSEWARKSNAFLVDGMADAITMDVMQLDYLLNHDQENQLAGAWKESAMTMWNEAKITLAPSGKCYVQVLVDMDTAEVRRPDGYAKGDMVCHGAESGWSAMIVRGAVMVAKHHPGNTDIKPAALNVLSKLDASDLTYYDNPDRFPPRLRFKTRFLSGDATANWLWTYWMGKYNGLW